MEYFDLIYVTDGNKLLAYYHTKRHEDLTMKNKMMSITLLLAMCAGTIKADTTVQVRTVDQIIADTKHSIAAAIKAFDEQAQHNAHPTTIKEQFKKDADALRKLSQMKSANEAALAAKKELSAETVKAVTAAFDKLSPIAKYNAAKTFFEAKV